MNYEKCKFCNKNGVPASYIKTHITPITLGTSTLGINRIICNTKFCEICGREWRVD